MKTITVTAPGKTQEDAAEGITGGWFAADNPPPEALEAAKAHGHKVFRFRLTIECLGAIES
jgi:hypothetical protein